MSRIQQEVKFWNNAAANTSLLYDNWLTNDTYNFIESFVQFYKPKQVLEIGSGNGRLLNRLGREHPEAMFIGIDIAEEQLVNVLDNDMPLNCMYKLCDGRSIPDTNRLFDMIFCVTVFQHIPLEAVASYIKAVASALQVNGLFLFQFIEGVENEPFSKHFNITDIDNMLLGNGFTIRNKCNAVHEQWTWIEAIKQ